MLLPPRQPQRQLRRRRRRQQLECLDRLWSYAPRNAIEKTKERGENVLSSSDKLAAAGSEASAMPATTAAWLQSRCCVSMLVAFQTTLSSVHCLPPSLNARSVRDRARWGQQQKQQQQSPLPSATRLIFISSTTTTPQLNSSSHHWVPRVFPHLPAHYCPFPFFCWPAFEPSIVPGDSSSTTCVAVASKASKSQHKRVCVCSVTPFTSFHIFTHVATKKVSLTTVKWVNLIDFTFITIRTCSAPLFLKCIEVCKHIYLFQDIVAHSFPPSVVANFCVVFCFLCGRQGFINIEALPFLQKRKKAFLFRLMSICVSNASA